MRRAGDMASDTARRGAQAVVESQRRIAQDAAQRFEEVSRKVADAAAGTTENMRQLMALPNAAEGGLRDMRQGMAGLVEGAVQTNLRAAQELFRLANPAPFVELQQRFAREYTDTMLRTGATLVRADAPHRRRDAAPAGAADRAQQQREAGQREPGPVALPDRGGVTAARPVPSRARGVDRSRAGANLSAVRGRRSLLGVRWPAGIIVRRSGNAMRCSMF
jgi:hypothetical protein